MAAEHGEPLTERELEITELVAEGLTNREVAEQLYVSHNTVKVHLRNIFAKTGVASRTELSMLAVQEGWISVPGTADDSDSSSASPSESSTTLSTEPSADTEDALRPSLLPSWPWHRWGSLILGIGFIAIALFLPQRRFVPASARGPGEIFGLTHAAPQVSDPTASAGWKELAPLPVRRAGVGVAAAHGKLYVIGGMTANGPSGRVDIYDIHDDLWAQGAPRPVDLANASAVSIGDKILVPGGCHEDQDWTPSAAVHLYDPQADSWTEVAPLPAALCAYALASYEDRVFVFGGWDGQTYRNETYTYDPGRDVWEARASSEQPRGFGGAATLADRIFYAGGYDGSREWATCEVYRPESNRWESCQSMLQPRGGLSLAATGGRIYAIGGGWQTPLGFNERYTPATDEWSVVETPIVNEWRNLGSVPWETSLYAVGGWSGTDFLNRTYAVEIMPWRVFIPGTFRSP